MKENGFELFVQIYFFSSLSEIRLDKIERNRHNQERVFTERNIGMLEEFRLEQIKEPLLQWFQKNARILPWREDATSYRVWVSEIMLQQTRVEAVKPYFERFITALPTVQALAECEMERLLKLWEGLGYYNRVRNMQIAAKTVMEKYDGTLPADYDKLLQLKGIGSYTAGAVASIAYDIAVPAVDGNVLRVITRVSGDTSDIMKQSVKKKIEQYLKEIMPKEKPGEFNQALMELGATVCVPNGMPFCQKCPWVSFCKARLENRISEIPVKTKQKKRRIEEKTVFVILQENRVLLHKRPKTGLLSGMYEFPNAQGALTEQEAILWLKERRMSVLRIQKMEPAKHVFSHIEWHMTGYVVQLDEWSEGFEKLFFVDLDEVKEQYPIPSAFMAYKKYLQIDKKV